MKTPKQGSPKSKVLASRILPKDLKEKILPLVTSSSRYDSGRVFGLRKPVGMGKITSKLSGVSLGADKDGFFVYTQRCRSASYKDALSIPKKVIDFVETTG